MATLSDARSNLGANPEFRPLFAARLGQTDDGAPAWLTTLAGRGGFAAAPQFAVAARTADDPCEPDDSALARAFADGEAHGRAMAQQDLIEQAETRAGLALSLARLDEALARELTGRLAETVAALCEATLAPLALDRELLERRCVDAAARVGEGVIDATLRLHPDDLDMLDPAFASTWHILSDGSLERGTVIFDTPDGAVVDGPGEWRDALREALGLAGQLA